MFSLDQLYLIENQNFPTFIEKLLAEPWKSISLTCPPMKGQLTYWQKDGRVIAFSNIVLHPGYTVQGSVLTIKNMTSSGVVYECSASHSVRNFEIKMQGIGTLFLIYFTLECNVLNILVRKFLFIRFKK